jgi:hypothetical protein
MPPLDPEVPEADALEQAQPVVPEPSGWAPAPMPKVPLEAAEADVLDQARDVGEEDDEWR